MSSLVEAEVLATCSALGYVDGNKYQTEPDCVEAIKDLIRYLKRDDDTHEIRRLLGSTQVLVTDLIPMLKSHWKNKDLLDVLLRLLVNLMSPALLLFNEELPSEKTERNYYLELVATLQRSKQAFADEKVFAVLTAKLGDLLKLDWEHRYDEDGLMIERILILVRNVLNVPANEEEEKRTDNDASVHDQVLWALHQSGMEDLLLYTASCQEESNLCMHVLEIISLMFREQDPTQLVTAGISRSQTEKQKDENELLEVKRRETAQIAARRAKYFATRHSRFGGTFCLRDVKSISEREVIYHRPLVDIDSLSFDRNKVPTRKPRHRRPLADSDTTRRSTLSIRLFLKEFCVEFLNSAYNPLMNLAKDNLSRQRGQAHDESYYFWAMKFFMEFNRLHNFKVDLVSETMSVHTFHFVQTQIDTCLESMTVDKKKIPVWARRLHLCLRAYRELLETLGAMDRSSDPDVCDSARVIKGNVFYNVDYRELTLVLIRQYDELKMSKSCLKDLVETIHVFLKLLEQFIKTSSHLVVQNKKRKGKSRKKKPAPKLAAEQTMEERWETLAGELSAVLQGRNEIPQDVAPFDAAAEISIEEQRAEAMYRIQDCLRKNNASEAVALFRAAREVWPEGNAFGASDIEAEEEFLSLREVFFTELPPRTGNEPQVPTPEDVQDEEEEEEDQAPTYAAAEQEFSFVDFVKKFASLRVVKAYCSLLKEYDKNTVQLNRCLLKMLHRIAWDCKFHGLLFQASVFRTFQKVFGDPSVNTSPIVKEIAKFAKFILGKFIQVAKANTKVFVELLFWKTAEDAYEIENGYGTYKKNAKATKQLWSSEQEDELQRLFERFKNQNDPDKDVVDLILDNLIDDTKTRLQVVKQLKRQQLIDDHRVLNKAPGVKRPPRVWQEHEEAELRQLHDQFKGSADILGDILGNMTVPRPRPRVVEKLLELGLVADRKELRKKRHKKDGTTRKRKSINPGDDQSDDDNGSSNNEEIVESLESSSEESEDDAVADVNQQPSEISLDTICTVVTEMREGFSWIVTSLQQVANDREADGDMEPVPLLPLSESSVIAMEDSKFLEFLTLIGLSAPNSEQEQYWRVPSSFTPVRLKRLIIYLEQVLAGDFSGAPPLVEQTKPKAVRKKKSANFEKLKAMAKAKKSVNKQVKQKKDGGKQGMVLNAQKPGKSKKARASSSEDDDVPLSKQTSQNKSLFNNNPDGNTDQMPSVSGTQNTNHANKRRLALADDSSDDDNIIDKPDPMENCSKVSSPLSHSINRSSPNGTETNDKQPKKGQRKVFDDSSDDDDRLTIDDDDRLTIDDVEQPDPVIHNEDSLKSTEASTFINEATTNQRDHLGFNGRKEDSFLRKSQKRRIIDSDDENSNPLTLVVAEMSAESKSPHTTYKNGILSSPAFISPNIELEPAEDNSSDDERLTMPSLKKKRIVLSDSDE